jgi:Helitron helicase-like domain at N-terminus
MSRALNEGFAFSALQATGRFVPFRGPANVVLEGRVYHQIRDVLNPDGRPAHWFIYDANRRAGRAVEDQPPQETLDLIRGYLERVNTFVRYFRSAADQIPDDTTPFAVELTVPPTGGGRGRHHPYRRLRNVDPRRVAIFGRTDPQPREVPVLSPYYEPLQYPLLFPHGTPGWGHNENGRRNRPFTQLQWYRCLFLSEPRFQILGRLGSEYAVDMFSRTEDERLEYLRRGRQLQAAGMDEAPDPSVADFFRYKIPASFMGSRAWCSDQVADALAIARQLSKPSFWLTVTTNPLWPEIQEKLRRGQSVFDAPTVVNRAFHGRIDKLKTFLRQHFGGLLYEIGVIEFQKRGLPHAHIVVKFKTEPPLSALDSFISAELPHPNEDPDLGQGPAVPHALARPLDPAEFPLQPRQPVHIRLSSPDESSYLRRRPRPCALPSPQARGRLGGSTCAGPGEIARLSRVRRRLRHDPGLPVSVQISVQGS